MNRNIENSPSEDNKPSDGLPLWFEPTIEFFFFGLVVLGLGPVTILDMFYGTPSTGWIDQYLVIWGYITIVLVVVVLSVVLWSRGFSPDDFSIKPKAIEGSKKLIKALTNWFLIIVFPMAWIYWKLKGWRNSMSLQIFLAVITIVIPLGMIFLLYKPAPE